MNFQHSGPKHLLARLPILLPVAAALTLPLGSCNTTSGAAIGGILGAGLGQAVGGDTEATILGGVIGAGVGAAIGYNVALRREARLLASREATAAELEAAQRESAAISASSREKSIERAEAYAEVHADEHQAAPSPTEPQEVTEVVIEEDSGDAIPEEQIAEEQIAEEPIIEEYEPEPAPTIPASSIPDDTLIGVIPLPNGNGVVLTDVKTGELLDNEVHQLEQIKDVSDDAGADVKKDDVKEDDDAKPFTLILSDKKTGKTRQYTAIYTS